MSYHEALADGVRTDAALGTTVYFPPCRFCGAEVFSYNYLRKHRYTCSWCRPRKELLLATGLFPLSETEKRKQM